MLLSQENQTQTILTPPLSNKNNDMSNLQDITMDTVDNAEASQNFNNMTFLQEQGEEGDDISLLYNEIFQNPMEVQNQGLMNLDEGALNDTFTTTNDSFIPPMATQDMSKLSAVNNALPFNTAILNNTTLLDNTTTDAATASNALINQAILASKAQGTSLTAPASSLLDPKIKAFPTTVANTSAAAARANMKTSIPSPMVQTPFLHPMFSTPSFSYLNDSAVTTNGVTSPLFEFTPPSTPPHTHTNGASKFKNIYKPTTAETTTTIGVVENSPLLCSDVFAVPGAVNKQIASASLENNTNAALAAFSPALNLPMKKLALFSPNVEDTAVSDVYPSSYNYLDDTMVNSPLLPVNEEVTTSSFLPLYNTGMYDVHSPFLMEKPDEGFDPSMSEASYMYDQISPNFNTAAGSTPVLLDTNKTNDLLLKKMAGTNPTVLKDVSPLLDLNRTSPYLTEQEKLGLTSQSPFLPEDCTSVAKPTALMGEQGQINYGKSPYIEEQAAAAAAAAPLGNATTYLAGGGEGPYITLNSSPMLPEQPGVSLRKKKTTAASSATTPSPLIIDPRYAAAASAYSKNSLSPVNPTYLSNKKRKIGVMDYSSYGPLAKIQRLQGKERNSLEGVASGFIKRNDTCVKPSPLLQEISMNEETVDNVASTAKTTLKPSNYLTVNGSSSSNAKSTTLGLGLPLNKTTTSAMATMKSEHLTSNSSIASTTTTSSSSSSYNPAMFTPNGLKNVKIEIPSNATAAAANAANAANAKAFTTNVAISSTVPLSSKASLSAKAMMNTTTTNGSLPTVPMASLPLSSSTKAVGGAVSNPATSVSSMNYTTKMNATTTSNLFNTNGAGTATVNVNGTANSSASASAAAAATAAANKLKKSIITPISLLPEFKDADPNFIKEYTTMLLTTKNAPSLVSMAGIKLDTKKAKEDDGKKSKEANDKTSKASSKTTKTPGKKGRRMKAAAANASTTTDSKPQVGEVVKMKFDIETKPVIPTELVDANGRPVTLNNKLLMPNVMSENGMEEMDYNDIPTINLGNTPNLDMLSPASTTLGGMPTSSLNSSLIKPISFNLNSNIQLVKKRAKKKYPCTYPGCTKSFSRPCHRQSHERSHENSRPFVCPECQRAFCRKHDMIRHQRIHSKERPYQCKICKRKFARGDALVRHRTRPTSSCFQADMALAKKIRQQQHRLLQQQQQLEYERLQKEKQMEQAVAAAAAAANANANVNANVNVNVNVTNDVVMTTPSVASASASNITPSAALAAEK